MLNEVLSIELWAKIITTIFCGFLIGLERQMKGKPIDIRTSILICLGTTLYIYLGHKTNSGIDTPRILGQLITGIGFLGGGVIMNREGLVLGVTSAAVVWLLAGIGSAIGLEHYALAICVTFVALFVLVGVEYLEKAFKELRLSHHHPHESKG